MMNIIKDAGILRILFMRITFIHYQYSVPTQLMSYMYYCTINIK